MTINKKTFLVPLLICYKPKNVKTRLFQDSDIIVPRKQATKFPESIDTWRKSGKMYYQT